MPVPAIETLGLTKYYGPHRGIEDVDLVVEAGQVFGFLGPNGAGKTTAMRVLLDFLRPTGGRASVLGLDSQVDSIAIRRRVGYLAGDITFYPHLTGRQTCRWLASLRDGAGLDRIEPLAERVGLDLDRPVGDLSTGNRQKIALVQAFMAEPDLLILDEPTAGLDPLVQHTFQEMVREVAAEGRTVFLSSHVLDEVERTCDRVGIIRDGRLITIDEVRELRRRSLREVRIRFAHPVDPTPFAALPGSRDVIAEADVVSLRFGGPPDALVKLAADYEVVDLISAPADLDDIFLAFYSGEDDEADEQGGVADG